MLMYFFVYECVYIYIDSTHTHTHEIMVSLVCVPARQACSQSAKLKDVAYDIPKL